MGLLADHQIRNLALGNGMIRPFHDGTPIPGAISAGCSSYGYDARLGRKFRVFDNWLKMYGQVVDPKRFPEGAFTEVETDVCTIPPNSFALGETLEDFDIPRDVLGICLGKSTYARCGIVVNVTPLEPEWKGKITLEISNTTPLPAVVYSLEGIIQILFLRADAVCERSYADKKGVYQSQTGLTLPRLREDLP